MATAKTSLTPDIHAIRPALVEAKLMTEKRARDAIYVVTLAEELRDIEVKIAAAEDALHLGSDPASNPYRPCRAPEKWPDADWIREKSSELNLRLRRIEQSSKQP